MVKLERSNVQHLIRSNESQIKAMKGFIKGCIEGTESVKKLALKNMSKVNLINLPSHVKQEKP